ncbi:glycosyltransferase family 39 protein [Nocardia sp. NPDC046473]|uniref:glycosyltransferase family 39 protein n=1 Tax=Nocardia sp. NPDC046473 TaxID=3155733 RepID=UPI0033E1BCEB
MIDRALERRIPTFYVGAVLAVAATVVAILCSSATRYGYFGDELYFIWAGAHPDWSYVDQPALVPLIARVAEMIAPGSLWVLRLPSAVGVGVAVVLAALIAREFGGGRRAQLMAAGALAVSPAYLVAGHHLHTAALDPALWTASTWLMVRVVRTRSCWALLVLAIVTAVAVNVKVLILALWLVVVPCAFFVRPRPALPSKWALASSAAIVAAGALPWTLWQANHGWPQLHFMRAVSAEYRADRDGWLAFPVSVLTVAGFVAGAALLCHGAVQLVRAPGLRPYRFLGLATGVLALLFLVTGGRAYYLAGLFPVCWAASAVMIERRGAASWWRWTSTWPARIGTLALSAILVLPLWTVEQLRTYPWLPQPVGELGWPQAVRSIAQASAGHPRAVGAPVLAQTCWLASAVQYYGAAQGIPTAHSANWGCWPLSRPTDEITEIVYAGRNPEVLNGSFSEIVRLGTVETGAGRAADSQGTPIWFATGRTEPWSVIWTRLLDLS